MYVGRIVAVGRNRAGQACAMYRVSSRSFPNRQAVQTDKGVAIVPKPGHESDIFRNPYIAYNCLRLVGRYGVVTNGSHTDFVAEKLDAGYGPRDALATVLQSMDYEHDQLDTPRIAAIVDHESDQGYLGIVRKDALLVQAFTLGVGEAYYVATYEHHHPSADYRDAAFDVVDALGACNYILGQGVFAELERPVTAACLLDGDDGYTVALVDAPPPAP